MILKNYDITSVRDYISKLCDNIAEETNNEIKIIFIMAAKKEQSLSIIADDRNLAIRLLDTALTHLRHSEEEDEEVPLEFKKAVNNFINSLPKT